jgi:hypothetical protein
MTKKLKMLSWAVLAAVGTATAAQAASTITNVIQDLTIAFTIYPSNMTKANGAGTVLASTVTPAALGTKQVLAAIHKATDGAFDTNTAKLVLLTQYTDTNVYVYSVNYVLNHETNMNVAEISTTASFSTFSNNVFYYLYTMGLTDIYEPSVSISTNFTSSVVLTNISTTPIYAVEDNGAITPITTLTPYPPYSSQTLNDQSPLNSDSSTSNYFPVFGGYSNYDTNGDAIAGGSPGIGLYNVSNDWFFSGTTKAIDGAAIFGTSMGITYALDGGGGGFYGQNAANGGGSGLFLALNSPADWAFNAALSGVATISTKNLGPAKDSAPINYFEGTWSATGTGWMGGSEESFVYTNTTPFTTNVWITNAIPFVLKGTVSLGAPTIMAAP